MAHTDTIMQNFPELLKRGDTLERYVEAHDLEFDSLKTDLDNVIGAHEVDNASGVELDRIGALFGKLGKRRNRNDDDYRIYLKSVIDSFNGRGSVSGLKFAIASALGSTTDKVEIDEDFENLAYDVLITDTDTEVISVAINDLAELADPSVVKLRDAIIVLEGDSVTIDEGGFSVTSETTGLGSNVLTLDGNSTLGP